MVQKLKEVTEVLCDKNDFFPSRDCKSTAFLCGFRDSPQIIFAWALNASGIRMPEGVGLKVGPSAKINYLVVQIHYGHPEGLLNDVIV